MINIGIDKVGHRKRFLRELDIVRCRSDNKMEQLNVNDVDDVPPPLPQPAISSPFALPNK